MFNEIKQYLDSRNWNYQAITQNGHRIFKMQLNGINGSVSFIIDVCDETVLTMAICSVNTPPEKRTLMAELLTRINFKMLLGNFDMDFEDGEVRFTLSWHYDPSAPVSQPVIDHNIMTCAAMLDRYLPAIMRINFSNAIPVTALQEVEGLPHFMFN
ncbi:hypothetical protein C7N43_35075 [Sphingobacteriales bacterium UPWRP_1]|nr:hypothetical protein C7N43_35075 [Sphingobacteriales bacterium UPWRP_1]